MPRRVGVTTGLAFCVSRPPSACEFETLLCGQGAFHITMVHLNWHGRLSKRRHRLTTPQPAFLPGRAKLPIRVSTAHRKATCTTEDATTAQNPHSPSIGAAVGLITHAVDSFALLSDQHEAASARDVCVQHSRRRVGVVKVRYRPACLTGDFEPKWLPLCVKPPPWMF